MIAVRCGALHREYETPIEIPPSWRNRHLVRNRHRSPRCPTVMPCRNNRHPKSDWTAATLPISLSQKQRPDGCCWRPKCRTYTNANRQFRRPSASRWRLAGSTLTLATILVLVPLAAHAQAVSIRYRLHRTANALHRHRSQSCQPDCHRHWRIPVRTWRTWCEEGACGRGCWIWYRRASGECADLAMGRLVQRNDDVHPQSDPIE